MGWSKDNGSKSAINAAQYIEARKTFIEKAITDSAEAKVNSNVAMKDAETARTNATQADGKSTDALSKANEAKKTAELVQTQFNKVIAEAGSNNPEVVQARGGEVNLNARLDKFSNALADTARQSSTLSQGTSVVSASPYNVLASVEIEGRTLTSLGNTPLEPTKKYVISDKKTKVIADGTTINGVGKFTKTGVSERVKIIRVENFDGKVAGSVVENPHNAKAHIDKATLLSPSSFVSGFSATSSFDLINKLDGTNASSSGNTVGAISQQLFSFNLIEAFERNIGRIPKFTVADKVSWLKANLNKLTFNWYGFGSSVGGNAAILKPWSDNVKAWANFNSGNSSHAFGTVQKLNGIVDSALVNVIATDGFVHYLAYANASDGVTPSVINTDYIELEIEIKETADFTNPKVALYEVSDADYAKILVDWNADEVVNRFPVVQNTQHLQGVGVFAEGDNLIPPFTEWTLHANAKVVSPYELELNSTGTQQNSNFDNIYVVPNQTYTLSYVKNMYLIVYALNNDGTQGQQLVFSSDTTKTFTIPTGINKIRLIATNLSLTGKLTVSQPILTLGSTAKSFVPRNPSYLYADVKLGAIGDKKDLLYEQDGRWLLRRAIEKDVVLDGSLAWAFHSDDTGYKVYRATTFPNALAMSETTATLVKYNGNRLKPNAVSMNALGPDYFRQISSDIYFYINASDTDTGFGETYTPSATETKAYFYGWKMNNGTFGTNYDGSGTKTWIPIGDTDNTRKVTVVPTSASPSQLSGTIQPHKLSYGLTAPTIIDVTDKVEGSLKLSGLTQVEVLSGIVRREKATIGYSSNTRFINDTRYGTSLLSKRVSKILGVFKNGLEDKSWIISSDTNAYGLQRASISIDNFDSNAEYTVTYVAMDKSSLTANPTNIKLTYANSIRNAVDDAVTKVQDNATMLSVHEKAIVDLYVRVKALEVK